MIFVKHRQNTIKKIQKLDKFYGAEIDIRYNGRNLVLTHDYLKEEAKFSEWLKYYNHKFLIANIKEEGIESSVIQEIKKKRLRNFFLLDVTVPMIIKLNSKNIFDFSLRVSKYENLINIYNFNNKNKWIWIDTYDTNIPFEISDLDLMKDKGFKICLVSPELISNKKQDISFFLQKYIKYIPKLDMVCTKFPEYWEYLIEK